MQLSSLSAWLTIQKNLGLRRNTIDAYTRALKEYATFCLDSDIEIETATREHVSRYIRALLTRPVLYARDGDSAVRTLSNSTVCQRITVVRLYYDYLIEEGVRDTNPVGRGSRVRNRNNTSISRPVIQRFHKMPWIPSDVEWSQLLRQAKNESIRNRLMFSLAYDAALRREELCLISIADLDPSRRLLHIKAETTKGRRDRVVPFSPTTGKLLALYLRWRRRASQARTALFVSESPRNSGSPITMWTWSKVVQRIANAAAVPQFSTHTFRHLCLTDLARAGWELHEIATFAGHRNISTTMLYIHLSGRDLEAKLRTFASFRQERLASIAEHIL